MSLISRPRPTTLPTNENPARAGTAGQKLSDGPEGVSDPEERAIHLSLYIFPCPFTASQCLQHSLVVHQTTADRSARATMLHGTILCSNR